MQTIEYRTVDKSGWGDGPWQSEPDKRQWRDEATGLPCLIVRGPSGALCGYVGVPATHPLHGKEYDAADVEVHGGLTFSDHCASMSPDRWDGMRLRVPAMQKEAARHPHGDAARWLAEWAPLLGDYDAWKQRMEARSVCHLAAPGDADNVWWLGFDCAHAWDISPAFSHRFEPDQTYRDIDYVTAQVQSLAKQLADIAA